FDLVYDDLGDTIVAATGFPGYDPSKVRVGRMTSSALPCSVFVPADDKQVELGQAVASDQWGNLVYGAAAVEDSEHFYTPDNTRVACASCHPDGGDDGQTWLFQAVGGVPRRTPALTGGLLATAPFHWEGDLPDLDALWASVGIGL